MRKESAHETREEPSEQELDKRSLIRHCNGTPFYLFPASSGGPPSIVLRVSAR